VDLGCRSVEHRDRAAAAFGIAVESPADWPEAAQAPLAAFWEARIARQKEIDDAIAARAESEYLYDPRWLITFTAIRPLVGFGNAREVSLFSVAHASASISAFSVVFSALYGSFAPKK
jgi:hypothetical protein